MNRQILYLLLVLVLVVAVSPILLRLVVSEGFAPPRVAPFELAVARPAEPHAILVSEQPIMESFHGSCGEVDECGGYQEEEEGEYVQKKPHVVSVSDTSYDAMSLKQRSDLLKNIQQMVREELMGDRTKPLLPDCTDSECDSCSSSASSPSSASSASASSASASSASSAPSATSDSSLAMKQGADFQKRSEKDPIIQQNPPKNPDGSCPSIPDLSKYIRKDRIPCWGCAIDY